MVLQFTKLLAARPLVPALGNVTVRNFAGPDDVDRWLLLRQRAFARQTLGVRAWDRADFERELLAKPWWSPERLWLAETMNQTGEALAVGTVALAERAQNQPAVHWLAVDPRWRRHGIGQLLMATLEAYCWDHGQRRIWLETHTAWREAVALYESLEYKPVRPS